MTAGRPVDALVPVATVFGPFHHDPVEAVTRELRAAIEGAIDYCAIHEVREPGPAYLVCFECGHAFPTPEALLADHAALVERLNAHQVADPFDDGPAEPLTPTSDPEEIRACPHCSHDF